MIGTADFNIIVRLNCALGCTWLNERTGNCLHNSLRSILDMIRISEGMSKFIALSYDKKKIPYVGTSFEGGACDA